MVSSSPSPEESALTQPAAQKALTRHKLTDSAPLRSKGLYPWKEANCKMLENTHNIVKIIRNVFAYVQGSLPYCFSQNELFFIFSFCGSPTSTAAENEMEQILDMRRNHGANTHCARGMTY